MRLTKATTVLTHIALTSPDDANALVPATPATSMQIAEGMGGAMSSAPQILGSSLGWAGDLMDAGNDAIEPAEEPGVASEDIPPPPSERADPCFFHAPLPQAIPNPVGPRISRPPNRPPPLPPRRP